ncbi:MAG: hypothetical protein HY370_07435 [Proteobacteria bacterium]|nr:hypothetical protein [Pseudomonadota bacterium]
MKKLIESLTGGYSSSAKVVDGMLILSLPDAVSPVIWRMELGHAKASAMEVRENGDGTVSLVLRTPRGETNEIAPFATRAAAVKALMAVSRALEAGQGRSTAQPQTNAAPMRQRGGLVPGLIAVGILIILISMFFSMMPKTVPMGVAPASGVPGATTANGSTAGVPVSADDFLRGR